MKLLVELLMFIAPFIVAQLTVDFSEWVQKVTPWFDRQSAIVKRMTVALVAFALTHAAAVLGGIVLQTDINALIGGDLSAVNPADVSSLMTAGLAYLFHNSNQTKKAATAATTRESDPGA